MGLSNEGQFSITISSNDLIKGLRSSKSVPRNTKFLTGSVGAIGLNGTLQSIEDLAEFSIDVSDIGVLSWPYPQIFSTINHIIVCTQTKIYELVSNLLVEKLDVGSVNAGDPWSLADFYDYLYLSNNTVVVHRLSESGVWEIASSVPVASGICNLNGQVLIGNPRVED